MLRATNLTPHTVTLCYDGRVYEWPASGHVARVRTTDLPGDHPWQIRKAYGDVSGLPDAERGCYYIVSLMVLEALPLRGDPGYRADVIAPDSGATAIRTETGQIKAVTRMVIK
jgi:hypothetical protein